MQELENMFSKIELKDVTTPEALSQYYAENNLNTDAEKADRLIKAMKIRAIRCEEEETEAERLKFLEHMVFHGYWRASL